MVKMRVLSVVRFFLFVYQALTFLLSQSNEAVACLRSEAVPFLGTVPLVVRFLGIITESQEPRATTKV